MTNHTPISPATQQWILDYEYRIEHPLEFVRTPELLALVKRFGVYRLLKDLSLVMDHYYLQELPDPPYPRSWPGSFWVGPAAEVAVAAKHIKGLIEPQDKVKIKKTAAYLAHHARQQLNKSTADFLREKCTTDSQQD